MSVPTELLVFAKTHPTHKSIIDLANAGYCYCTPCKQIKPIDAFRPNPARANGAQSTCKECEIIYNRKRNKTEHRREYQNNRHKNNREYHREWMSRWRRNPENRLKIGQARKKYRTREKQNTTVIRGVYILRMGNVFKIGKSNNIHRRLAELRGMLPFPAELIHHIAVEDDLSLAETALHQLFIHRRMNGEWFGLTPDDIEAIKKAYGTQAKE